MSDALLESLRLVWPAIAPVGTFVPRAWVDGKPAGVEQAIDRAAALLAEAQQPIIAGLNLLTIQAAGAVIELARAARARLVPVGYAFRDMPVMQDGTLEQAFRSDFILKPGPQQWATDHPIAAAVAERVLHSLFVPPDLGAVLRLRAAVKQRGGAAITDITMKPVNNLAILLPPDTRSEAISQWHQLAADLQCHIRTCVLQLPEMSTAGNIRGSMEILTWRSGCYGPVDFTGDEPRCGRGPFRGDVVLEAAATVTQVSADKRIVIGPAANALADVAIATPGIALGLAGQVMRFDGAMLDLCPADQPGVDDPAIAVFRFLTAHLQRLAISR